MSDQVTTIEYLPINSKCEEMIAKAIMPTTWLTVLEGGKRASKNVLSIMTWAYIIETHPDKLHLAAGFSLATAETNIIDCNGFGLEHIFKGRCRWGKYKENKALYINTATGEKIVIVVGGGKADSLKRIKGNTFGTAYLDEANELHETFVRESIDRLISSKNIKQFWTLNPKDPHHWLYEIIDPYKKLDGYYYFHFTINDNPAISDERKAHILSTYDTTSVWYKRDIEGLRVTAEGLIYRWFADHNANYLCEASDYKPSDFMFISIGVDFGGNKSGHAFNATGILKGFKGVVILADYWSDKEFSPHELDLEFLKFTKQVLKSGYRVLEIRADSANQVLIRGLRNIYRINNIAIPIRNAMKGRILDRISFYNRLIGANKIKIVKECKPTIKALNNAIWDAKHHDERLDDGTVLIDNLDAMEYSTEPHMDKIIQMM